MTSPETTQATGNAADPDSRVGVGATPFHSETETTRP
jgi:hypothetical protein